jgi:hypothetical protein
MTRMPGHRGGVGGPAGQHSRNRSSRRIGFSDGCFVATYSGSATTAQGPVSQRRQWVESGSSVFALERPLPCLNLTFTCKRPLAPLQPASVPAPDGPSWWRTSAGICGGIESEMVADLDRNRRRLWSGIRTHRSTPTSAPLLAAVHAESNPTRSVVIMDEAQSQIAVSRASAARRRQRDQRSVALTGEHGNASHPESTVSVVPPLPGPLPNLIRGGAPACGFVDFFCDQQANRRRPAASCGQG